MHSISRILEETSRELDKQSATPQLDAQLLLAFVLKCSRTTLHTWPEREITENEYQQFQHLYNERLAGKPIAYLLGTQAFWKFDLHVTQDVLIPRADTELLVEKALELFGQDTITVLELGTGSGAIALALSYERPQWKITATDKSAAALIVAHENAQTLGVDEITWLQSDWYAAFKNKKYNLIISNPPYIDPEDKHLSDLRYEPQSALIADNHGLADLEYIILNAAEHLLPNGYIMVEHGYQQAQAVQALMIKAGFEGINTYKDLGGNERVTLGRNKCKEA